MSSPPTTPREIEAQAAAQAAERGDLPYVGSYKLQFSADQYRIGAPPLLVANTPYDKGSPSGVYLDMERGMLVYDFQTGSEYRREGGHGED